MILTMIEGQRSLADEQPLSTWMQLCYLFSYATIPSVFYFSSAQMRRAFQEDQIGRTIPDAYVTA